MNGQDGPAAESILGVSALARLVSFRPKTIRNWKIGRKLGVVLGAIAGQLALLVALSIWSLHLSTASMDQAQQRSGSMLLAWRISSDLADTNTQMANLIISADLKLDTAQVISLERDCTAALAEISAVAGLAKEQKLTGTLRTSIESWRKSNDEVVRLAGLGQRDKAAQYYRTEAQDRYGDAKAVIGDLLDYRHEQLNQIGVERNRLVRRINAVLLGIGFLAIGIAVVSGRKLTRSIARPLATAERLLAGIAKGDISQDVPAEFTERGDEIGGLARAMQAMSGNLRTMVQEISGTIDVLSSSSAELLDASSQMTNGSRQASDKAHSVSAAAEQMSSNITSVASGMEHANTNLANVAQATERTTRTIGEIAGNSENARRITGEAKQQAALITEEIAQLGEAARAIGKITETITQISSQTNLLALNATIEAARAGSAGRGFAVVATEIKALAQQTATATEDIKARIINLQAATSTGIAKVGRVSEVIDKVTAIVASIAAAIEEQAGASKIIAGNILEATAGVSDVNMRVSEASIVSREIAKDIVIVDRAASEMAGGGERLRSNSSELSKVAGQLKILVGRFRS
jgi:methyl-accepting chemotaxis protein